MLNVLYEKFPEHVTVNGEFFPIETDFREWIRFVELAEDDSVPLQAKVQLMLGWYTDRIPADIEAAVSALGDFLAAKRLYPGKAEEGEERSVKPAFSFEEDAGCIYSAFIECYGIDIQTIDYMHWWKFKTLFDNLPEKTEIKQRMIYRTIDISSIKDKEERKRIRKIQSAIALKKKRCLDDYEIGDIFS